jgi:hypothetical protein
MQLPPPSVSVCLSVSPTAIGTTAAVCVESDPIHRLPPLPVESDAVSSPLESDVALCSRLTLYVADCLLSTQTPLSLLLRCLLARVLVSVAPAVYCVHGGDESCSQPIARRWGADTAVTAAPSSAFTTQ